MEIDSHRMQALLSSSGGGGRVLKKFPSHIPHGGRSWSSPETRAKVESSARRLDPRQPRRGATNCWRLLARLWTGRRKKCARPARPSFSPRRSSLVCGTVPTHSLSLILLLLLFYRGHEWHILLLREKKWVSTRAHWLTPPISHCYPDQAGLPDIPLLFFFSLYTHVQKHHTSIHKYSRFCMRVLFVHVCMRSVWSFSTHPYTLNKTANRFPIIFPVFPAIFPVFPAIFPLSCTICIFYPHYLHFHITWLLL